MANNQILGNLLLFPGAGTPAIDIKSDLTPCPQSVLEQACQLITPTNRKDQTIDAINAEIANLINASMASKMGPVYNSDGDQIGEVIDRGGLDSDGLRYATVASSYKTKDSTSSTKWDRSEGEETNPAPALSTSSTKNNKSTPNPSGYSNQTGFRMHDTIGGADISIFYIAEVIDQSSLRDNTPLAVAKKNLIMVEFDSVLSLTYSTIRERFPVRSLGSANPKGITNGIRTISGHIAFNIFTEDVLSRLRAGIVTRTEKVLNPNSILGLDKQYNKMYGRDPLDSQCKTMLLDQLPPFHLLIMGVTERGMLSRMMIRNVSIIDENQYQGTQQPNIINKVSFVAEDIVPMTATQYSSTFVTGSLSSFEESYVGGNWDYNGSMTDMTASSLLDIEASSVLRKTTGSV